MNFELLDAESLTHQTYLPIWLEIDKGSMYRQRFQQHVEDRIEFIRSDQYADFFGAAAVRIAYATISDRSEIPQRRLSAMRHWTQEVLTDLKLTDWASVFYFASLAYEDIYTLTHFSEPVWHTPSDAPPRHLLEL